MYSKSGGLDLARDASDLLRIMGEASRFRILRYLKDKPRNVSEIVRALRIRQSLVSHHLKVLREHGLLEAMRDGPFVCYSVSSPEVERIFLLADKIASKNRSVKGDKR